MGGDYEHVEALWWLLQVVGLCDGMATLRSAYLAAWPMIRAPLFFPWFSVLSVDNMH